MNVGGIRTMSGSNPVQAPRLVKGATGPEVVALQRMLNALGFYKARIDGSFGPVTDRAVRAFQARFGLEVDGWAGPKTLAALQRVVADQGAEAALARGAVGPAVSEAQARLKELGFYPATVDGQFGPVTERGVRAFQASAGLPATGLLDAATASLLKRAVPRPAPEVPVSPAQVSIPAAGPADARLAGMIDWAETQLGTPYAAVNPFRFGNVPWDGKAHVSVNGSGTVFQYPKGTKVYDCSGFVVAAFRQLGVDLLALGLASSSNIHRNAGGFLQDVPREALKPGDLITFSKNGKVGHVGIYLGDGRMIHASGGKGVNIAQVDWDSFHSARRVPLP